MMEREFRQVVQKTELDAGAELLLAVSGGVDSVVLLDLLARAARKFVLRLQILHLDHQIRPESGADAEFVRKLCAQLNLPCQIETVDVPALAQKKHISLETAGREARRERLLCHATKQGCCRIVLAHHQDDQAETFLQRLLRGSGVSGLQAMHNQNGLWWRPLLGFSRQQILRYARQRQLAWVEDASNADTRFLRNRIRHQLLPQLREYNPQISKHLSGLSRQFQQEEDFWQLQVSQSWPRLLLSANDGLRLSRPFLLGCHPALQVRLLREGLRRLRGDLGEIEAVHLEALHKLLYGRRPQAERDLPGCWAARRYDQLWLRLSAPSADQFELQLQLDQPLELPDGRIIEASLRNRIIGEDITRVEFAAEGLSFPLQVRNLRPGDRFQPSGMQGHRKIKDFLVDLKLEQEQRRALPLLIGDPGVMWLVGLRRSALAPVAAEDCKILEVQLFEAAKSATKLL